MILRGFFVCSAFLLFLAPYAAVAGTTGGLIVKVTDAATGSPIAGAAITIKGYSGGSTGVTDASGVLRFNSLAPDSYTVTVAEAGYGTHTEDSFVFADQTSEIDAKLGKAASTASVGAVGVVQPGVTSNFASIDAANIAALRGLQGNTSYDQTYAAMNSQPGVFSPQGQPGWYQRVYIAGGDQDQPGYEYDGIPVERRDWQSSPLINFSDLGVQELQVYTGGLLATSDATGIAGYVNEVVKSGSSPSYIDVNVGSGGPMFYHSISVEAGGASKNFSYYVGLLGDNSTYRYINQQNGAGLEPGYFFPVQLDSSGLYCNAVPSGYAAVGVTLAPGKNPALPPVMNSAGQTGMCFDTGQRAWNGNAGFESAPGNVYGIGATWDRENVGNFHFAIPHKHDGLKDDVQVLVMESEIYNNFDSSNNDYGNPYPFVWEDGYIYNGSAWSAPTGSTGVYTYPGSPSHAFQAALPNGLQDYWSNGAAIAKLQYQWNINARTFLRLFGYTTYSDWLLNAPASLNTNYGLEAADWEPNTHTSGYALNFASQLNKNNYLTITAGDERTRAHGWSSFGLFGQSYTPVTNYVDSSTGYCYNPTTGAQDSCYDAGARGTLGTPGAPNYQLPTGYTCGGVGAPAACSASPQWLVTETGANHLTWDATPIFTAFSFNDQFRPSDQLSFDVGFRTERFEYQFPNVLVGFPARQFWFNTYNNEHCIQSGVQNIQVLGPVLVNPGSGGLPPNCGAYADPLYSSVENFTPANLTPNNPSSLSSQVYEPRVGAAWTLNHENVVRASYGVGARPPTTAWMQFGGQMQDLASFIGNSFLQYGFNSPVHPLQPDRSYNLDATWEHDFKGTDMGFRVTPYYRSTANQQQVFAYDAVLGLTAGLNVGQQRSSGVEFEFVKGDFSRQGVSWKVAYTHNTSRITYNNFPNGTNVIDQINYYVRQYNQYTQFCAGANPSANLCGLNYTGVNATPTINGVYNPYFSVASPAQPFDRNGSYIPYDVFPAPFYGDNSYDMPDYGSLTVNYRVKRWAFTPSIVFDSGSYYGNPLATPGYDPASCTVSGVAGPGGVGLLANPTTCTRAIFTPQLLAGQTQFDQIGEFRQPWRLSGDIQLTYYLSAHVRARLTVMHIFDLCSQRGYSWDRSYICEYSQLPGNVLPPLGNVTTLPLGTTAPAALQYPYGAWNINYNTDYMGVTMPFQANLDLEIKI